MKQIQKIRFWNLGKDFWIGIKNFIKEKQNIEFEKNYKIKNLNNEMER